MSLKNSPYPYSQIFADSPLHCPAVECKNYAQLFTQITTPLNQRESANKLTDLTNNQSVKLANEYLSILAQGVPGQNCSEYVAEALKSPELANFITSQDAISKSIIPIQDVNFDQKGTHLVVYWGSELQQVKENEAHAYLPLGTIEMLTNEFPDRQIALHVSIAQNKQFAIGKFSKFGGVVKHKIEVVPTFYGEYYSWHLLPDVSVS